ncbi:TPA: phosphoadenosine phosphosulfate reductase family protein [Klebsiella pneumoniae]|uniref:phosphoadenosine phosphosulfate reductase family protein n=1 Tax=Klebsiella pneumoniae TaxID=573 RepID=UPI000E1FD9D1|nr:phosphoadenosine phosphosulfate reductase family protein [Klebsiella pneumoniae]EIY4902205.1 phosphoadenosine phosphosulfate reductase family protein [Klebsiella quasipneumoniae]HBQ5923813.1 phosphoadenosine phosphosulfate reductase family protein [Klebsiella pneumoniae subsp. pneumoniae]EKX9436001.1 phosphoadenosine phosphosulfate reductase family protein [Klebsiella pneumoniae]MCD5889786.1 phosphoadenosine phosphosulfate reductase family protein [Klebsiella pneumoniae]QBI34696.1 hypotheti
MERHVLGLSGGKDSAALAIYMRQNYPDLNIEYFFTDTGKELPEVYDFLGKLEGFLGKSIVKLNPKRDFDFWLREYNHFLPSPQTRWCTRQLKLLPFEQWVRPMLANGDKVYSYVAIRADEDYREGYSSSNRNLKIVLPFRDDGIDKTGVGELLEKSGVGWPDYYQWRSRSGCTFCFYQQKIEWVMLKEYHPDKFIDAKKYEKDALEHGSPFTWTQGESLSELEKPERIAQIKKDYKLRVERERRRRPVNPLRPNDVCIDIDDLYYEDEGGGACNICHK